MKQKQEGDREKKKEELVLNADGIILHLPLVLLLTCLLTCRLLLIPLARGAIAIYQHYIFFKLHNSYLLYFYFFYSNKNSAE